MVNLLAPIASASPIFVEICSGHRMVLVPVDDGQMPVSCEACPVCCTGVVPPVAWLAAMLVERDVAHRVVAHANPAIVSPPRRIARAPPFPSV